MSGTSVGLDITKFLMSRRDRDSSLPAAAASSAASVATPSICRTDSTAVSSIPQTPPGSRDPSVKPLRRLSLQIGPSRRSDLAFCSARRD